MTDEDRDTHDELLGSLESIAEGLQHTQTGDTVADVIEDGLDRLANSITPRNTTPGHDETDGTVASLTEAVMGITAGLCRIASALESVAEAIRERKDAPS